MTYKVSGFVNGDAASVLSGGAQRHTAATAASGVGGYPISVGAGTLTAANYDFPAADLIGNTLTVTPAPLSITADTETKLYGAAVPALNYVVSGFVNGDTANVLSGVPSLATTATASSGVGGYPISVGVGTLSAANYGFPAANLIGNALTVTPAPLTITANAETKVYGADVPTLTYEVSGFVNGDTAGVLSGASQPHDHRDRFERRRRISHQRRRGNTFGRQL